MGEPDWDVIGELCILSSALKTAQEARLASENIGHQRAELAAKLRDANLAQEFLRLAIVNCFDLSAGESARDRLRTFFLGNP